MVSDRFRLLGEHVRMNTVKELPPTDSSRMRVSFDYRYGIWDFPAAIAVITLLRLLKLEFMLFVSCKFLPVIPALFTFSEPAKSTRDSLLDLEANVLRWDC